MSKRKKKLTITIIGVIGGLLFMWINPLNAQASFFDFWNDDAEIISFLQNHSDWLQKSSLFSIMGRSIIWSLIKVIYFIVSLLEGLIPESLSLLSFLDDSGMQGIISAIINDLVVALMVLVLVYLGFKTVVAKNPPNFKSVGVNIFISAFLILGMPTLMNTMEDISLKFYDATQTGENNQQVTSLAWGLIQDNTADLLYVANQGFDLIANDSQNTNPKNLLTPEVFKTSNLTEVITSEVIKESNGEQLENLKYELSYNEQGNAVASEIESSKLSAFASFFDEGYFRYSTKFMPILIGLIGLAVAYAFTAFVLITTIIEIGFKRVVGLFVFATDLESGQRTKMVIQDIGNAFMLIAFTGLSLRMYTMFLSFLSTSDVNPIIYVVAIVSATIILIKGSNTILRYFGVDVGLKEGFGQLAGAFALGKTLSHLGKNGKKPNNKEKDQSDVDNNSDNDGQLKKSINNAGKTLGYAKTRGLGGMAEDAIKGTGEKISGGIKGSINSVKDPWKDGVSQGESLGQVNQEKWNSRNQSTNNNGTENASASEMKNSTTGKETPINDLGSPQSQKMGPYNQEGQTQGQTIDSGNKTVNAPKNQDQGTQSNEEVLRKIKLDEAMNSGNIDIEGNTKMKSTMQGNSSSQNEEIKQRISREMDFDEVAPSKEVDITGNMRINPSDGSVDQSINQVVDNKNNGVNPLEQNINTTNSPQRQPSMENITQKVERADLNTNTPGTEQTSKTGDIKMNPSTESVDQRVNPSTESVDQRVNQVISNKNNAANSIEQQVNTVSNPRQSSMENITQRVDQASQNTNSPGVAQPSMQRIIQQVDKTSFTNPEQARQSIIREVQKSSFGSNDTKQRVMQEIERSNIATPQQLKQNVEQVFSKSGLPNEVQTSVQKVIQEIQSSGSYQPQEVKAKVMQEIEKAPMDNFSIKQNVIQEVEKAFKATPIQEKQNIKQSIEQIVETTENQKITTQTQQETKQKVEKESKGYFGSLLPDDLKIEPIPRKSNRFERFKKK